MTVSGSSRAKPFAGSVDTIVSRCSERCRAVPAAQLPILRQRRLVVSQEVEQARFDQLVLDRGQAPGRLRVPGARVVQMAFRMTDVGGSQNGPSFA
jgi:hypothetical protein